MAGHNLNVADEKLINAACDFNELEKRLPHYRTLYENIQNMKRLQAEISTLGKFTKQSGFIPGRNFQRVATVPVAIVHSIWQVDPDFWQDDRKRNRFFLQHPEFDTRTKVT